MKVIIAGSRSIYSIQSVVNAVKAAAFNMTEVVSGTAAGADRLGERFAHEQNLLVKKFPANWEKFGKGAGFIRNKEMAEYADALIAVWDGKSRGTLHMIETMKELNKPYYVYTAR